MGADKRKRHEGPPSQVEGLTFPEAMAYLGVSRNTLYDWVHRGLIPYRWAGDHWRLRFDKAELQRWLDR